MNSEGDLAGARMRCTQQRCCQHPNCPAPFAPWEPHHVVYAQELGRLGQPRWHPDNVVRLCRRCHARHHGIDPLPLRCVPTAAMDYAFSVMGQRAFNYLTRHYAGSDPRAEAQLVRLTA